jgi:hypothetical protein
MRSGFYRAISLVAPRRPRLIFERKSVLMDYEAFTNESLTMMYEGIRGALRADDDLQSDGRDPRFRVRQTPEWKRHAARLEAEMLRRGMFFEVIDW